MAASGDTARDQKRFQHRGPLKNSTVQGFGLALRHGPSARKPMLGAEKSFGVLFRLIDGRSIASNSATAIERKVAARLALDQRFPRLLVRAHRAGLPHEFARVNSPMHLKSCKIVQCYLIGYNIHAIYLEMREAKSRLEVPQLEAARIERIGRLTVCALQLATNSKSGLDSDTGDKP